MPWRPTILLTLILAILAASCGDGSETTIRGVIKGQAKVPGGAERGDVDVIDGWVSTLAEGDVEGAANYFAIPSTAVNGGVVLRIDSVEKAILFNRSLPCGAELVRAIPNGDRTVATFVLTERPGSGVCGTGTGQRARTAFRIEDGKIVQWRRVEGGGGGGASGDTV
jgi:limonene-1,2-epoxide hydrolase